MQMIHKNQPPQKTFPPQRDRLSQLQDRTRRESCEIYRYFEWQDGDRALS